MAGWPTSSNVSAGLAVRLEVQQQPQRLERLHAVEQMGFVDRDHRVASLLAIGRQESFDAANARLYVVCLERAIAAVQFIGQVGQQLGRRHLRKHQSGQAA